MRASLRASQEKIDIVAFLCKMSAKKKDSDSKKKRKRVVVESESDDDDSDEDLEEVCDHFILSSICRDLNLVSYSMLSLLCIFLQLKI